MRSFFPPGQLSTGSLALSAEERVTQVRAQPFACRLRLAMKLVDRGSAVLRTSLAEARELAATALAIAVPTAQDEERSIPKHLLLIALDVAATAYTVEAEAWLLEGRSSRATAPAALARRLALDGSGDPLVFGAVEAMLGLRAWLHGNLGRSLRHLEEAILHFAEAGDPGREAEAWDRTATVLEQAGLLPEAELAWARVGELAERESEVLLAEPLADSAPIHQEAAPTVNLLSVRGI